MEAVLIALKLAGKGLFHVLLPEPLRRGSGSKQWAPLETNHLLLSSVECCPVWLSLTLLPLLCCPEQQSVLLFQLKRRKLLGAVVFLAK